MCISHSRVAYVYYMSHICPPMFLSCERLRDAHLYMFSSFPPCASAGAPLDVSAVGPASTSCIRCKGSSYGRLAAKVRTAARNSVEIVVNVQPS